jgi:diamine N-acetyltransferase
MKGNKIILRALEIKDADSFFKWENESEAFEQSAYLQPISYFTIQQFIEQANRPVEETNQLRLIVETIEGEAVGLIDIFEIDFRHRRAGLGIIIQKEFRNKGFATEAIQLMCHYAVNKLNLELLYSDIRITNTASIKAFTHAGFKNSVVLHNWDSVAGKRIHVERMSWMSYEL